MITNRFQQWALVLVLAIAGTAVPAQEILDLSTFPRATVEITSGSKVHRFQVWVADTPERQRQGLMFVRDLPADCGMIFLHDRPRRLSMWMKNTYIELDMLFIAADGRIAQIVERTRPHSLETIQASEPVTAVLELKGGEAERRQLRVGDHLTVEPSA